MALQGEDESYSFAVLERARVAAKLTESRGTAMLAEASRLLERLRGEDQVPAGSLFGEADDANYWLNPVAPVPRKVYQPLPIGDVEEVPAGSLFGEADDNNYWQNWTKPVPRTVYQPLPILPDPEELPAGRLFGEADDANYWQNWVKPIAPTVYEPLPLLPDPDEFAIIAVAFQPDEDYPSPSAFIAHAYQPLPIDPDEVSAGSLFGQDDEDYWVNAVTPAIGRVYQPLPINPDPDELVVITPFQPDDDAWSTAPTPLLARYQSLPGDPEEVSAGSLSGQPDEDLWDNPVRPVSAKVYQPLPIGDPEELSAGALFGQDDEDYWQNPVAPVASKIYQPLPIGDVEELPAGELFGAFEEDLDPRIFLATPSPPNKLVWLLLFDEPTEIFDLNGDAEPPPMVYTPWRVASLWAPDDGDVQFDPVPPVPPEPPTPQSGGGYGPAGGSGGGTSFYWSEDPPPTAPDRRRPRGQQIDTGKQPTPSSLESISKFLRGSSVGFVGSKAITRLAEQHLGKHAGGLAALGSIAATAAAAGKLADKTVIGAKLEGPLVIGSVLAAIDDLVGIYVDERGRTTPQVVPLPTVEAFITRANETGNLMVTKRSGRRKSTGERVIVLRYTTTSEKPPTTWSYQEVVTRQPSGLYRITGTLLAAIRKVQGKR